MQFVIKQSNDNYFRNWPYSKLDCFWQVLLNSIRSCEIGLRRHRVIGFHDVGDNLTWSDFFLSTSKQARITLPNASDTFYCSSDAQSTMNNHCTSNMNILPQTSTHTHTHTCSGRPLCPVNRVIVPAVRYRLDIFKSGYRHPIYLVRILIWLHLLTWRS